MFGRSSAMKLDSLRRLTQGMGGSSPLAMVCALLLSLCTLFVSNEASSQTSRSPVVIPFELHGSHAFIEVRLQGETLSFVFDTGAGGTAINERTAQGLGLEASGTAPAIGVGGRVEAELVSGLTLELGQSSGEDEGPPVLRLLDQQAALLPLEHLEEHLGRPLDGIIGAPVLRAGVVLLDHDRSVLQLHDARTMSFEGWGSGCRVGVGRGLLGTEGEVLLTDGTVLPGRLVLDSGAGLYLSFNTPFVNRNRLVERADATFSDTVQALTGRLIPEFHGVVAGVRFCGFDFPERSTDRELPYDPASLVPVRLTQTQAGMAADTHTAGLVGNEVLKRFNIVFDLERDRIFLQPNKQYNSPIKRDSSGLRLMRTGDGTTVVARVIDSSPADGAGVKPEDVLASIDGQRVEELTLPAVRSRLQPEGERVYLRLLRDGETHVVELELQRH